ncbi:MAG: ATP-binding cassette domain-containing protein [Thalassobaculum sp.]|uniref:ATP-binding cassette domain-containing protein n=1 Tax=Thalassobaculum sp. TaxID=2022740 RepID=UPI0032EF115F
MRLSPELPADPPATGVDAATGAGAVLPLRGSGLTIRRAGRTLLDRVDIAVEPGPLTVIMGPNGAGKSLLLRVLATLVRPDEGIVTWAGTLPDRARAPRLGFVFQKPVMLRRSAIENVRYALKVAGVPRAERDRRAAEALAAAGLERLAASPARVLSGGEQQRLAIARALAVRPEVLLLDEPTANLDPGATQAIEAQVAAAHRAGTKVVFVTHDIGQARRLADEVVFVHHGRIAERAPAGRFFTEPSSEAAIAFTEGRLLP